MLGRLFIAALLGSTVAASPAGDLAEARRLVEVDLRFSDAVGVLRGKRLGMTPMENVEVPTGTHTLELRNPELDIRRTTQILVRPGKATRVNLTL